MREYKVRFSTHQAIGLYTTKNTMNKSLIQPILSGINRMTTNVSPEYTILDNIRYVKPYFQLIQTTVKTRWLNRTVLDVLSSEFRSISKSEYLKRLKKNEIVVVHQQKLTKQEKKERRLNNGSTKLMKRIEYPEILQFKLQGNDIIERLEHIHERSVYGVKQDDIEVIHEDEEVLVVNKPSGIPIHPVQNYYYNSFVKILEFERWGNQLMGREIKLNPCHRLDKLTSGVCIFAKTKEAARRIQLDIQNREVEKVYIARVKGKFAKGEVECNDDIIVLDTKKGKQDGVMRKTAKTIFNLISYNPDLNESIVMCLPKTGRTHQIRIHLRNLKHPITNDPLYGEGMLMSLSEDYNLNTMTDAYFDEIESKAAVKRADAESGDACDLCGITYYHQTKAKDLVMYLHAFKYGVREEEGWRYETKFPDWTNI